jgi:hypothetical protein
MVQTETQYEFIYEFTLNWLRDQGYIKCAEKKVSEVIDEDDDDEEIDETLIFKRKK